MQFLGVIQSVLFVARPIHPAHGPVLLSVGRARGRWLLHVHVQYGHETGALRLPVKIPCLHDRLPVQFDVVAAHAIAGRVRDLEFVNSVAKHFLELEFRVAGVTTLVFCNKAGGASERPRGVLSVAISRENEPPVILTGLGGARD